MGWCFQAGTPEQVDAIVQAAVSNCERYYAIQLMGERPAKRGSPLQRPTAGAVPIDRSQTGKWQMGDIMDIEQPQRGAGSLGCGGVGHAEGLAGTDCRAKRSL